MTGAGIVLLTTFLASAVEAIEMVTIVVGVGATRGYRATLLGAAGGLVVLAVTIAVGGLALAAIPVGPLRLIVGTLLLLFGLQWYRKGIVRVAVHGFAGYHAQEPAEDIPPESGFDWTAAFLAFKGVSLEGLEIAIIVVSFGASAGQLGVAIFGGAAAIVVVGALGFALKRPLERIPRSFLQLVVGTLLTSFGSFWALEGLGVQWPQSDGDIVLLLVFYALSALTYIGLERRARQQALQAAQP
jgi:Ca2+/H+ antiporter, TMEM165/GDT1 family